MSASFSCVKSVFLCQCILYMYVLTAGKAAGKPPGFFLGCKELAWTLYMHDCTKYNLNTLFSPTDICNVSHCHFNTIISEELPTTVLITTGACQCRSTQRDSSAFRKNHCDKAPVTNWNCGKDKHCSSIMLCKHKTGIISWQCWEKIEIFFIKKDIQSTYDVSQRQSNHAYPSVKQEQVYAPHKFPWITSKSPHKLCKKLPVENIWQSTGMRNILIFHEFDNNLRLLILLGLQSYLEDNYFSNKSMIIPGWKAGVIWKHNYQILCKTRHLINPLAQADWLCQGWEQKNVCLLFWWFP